MLRMYFIANWFNPADEACEDALYDTAAFRDFCRIDLRREGVPDATSLLNFRHLLEQQRPGAALSGKVGEMLQASGMKLSGGTIVDATITPTNVHDSQELPNLLHGNETRLYGDGAYAGQKRSPEANCTEGEGLHQQACLPQYSAERCRQRNPQAEVASARPG